MCEYTNHLFLNFLTIIRMIIIYIYAKFYIKFSSIFTGKSNIIINRKKKELLKEVGKIQLPGTYSCLLT